MSVAFRRESDDEHREPRFELPIPPGPNRVTPRGLRLIEERVAVLEGIAAAAEPEAHARELRYWRRRLATAQLQPVPATDEIGFGSRATIRLNGAVRQVEIVGDDEADPTVGLLALSAPLARALVGAGVGDVLAFGTRADAIEVLTIGDEDPAARA